MKTIDQILKIKAAIQYILNHVPGEVDYIRLFKIMYFAQQRHLVIYGLPLIDESFVARKHGPVPSFTYKAFRCAEGKVEPDTKELQDFISSFIISTDNTHKVVACSPGKDCDMDELSQSNIRVLDQCISQYKDISSFGLSDLSHDRAWEWAMKQTEITGEDTRISQYSMAEAGGASERMLEVIRDRQNSRRILSWT